MDYQPTKEAQDSQMITFLMHKVRQSEFTQAVRDRMKQNQGKPENMQTFQKLFQESDFDGDEKLNLQEYLVFRKKLTEWQAQMNGEATTLPEALDTIAYNRMNDFWNDYDGIKQEDLMKTMKIFGSLSMKPELHCRVWYFEGLYGRAEPMRLLLTHANIPWEDVSVKMSDWPHLKQIMPGGTLPALENKDGSMKGGATRATVRFLAMSHGYYPQDPIQAQQCDMIVDGYVDLFDLSGDAAFGKGFDPSTIPDCRTKYWAKLDDFLTFLEPYCAKGQFLCGNKLSVADFWVGAMVTGLFKNPNSFGHEGGADSFESKGSKYPAFMAYCDRFCAENKKRMDTRPALPF